MNKILYCCPRPISCFVAVLLLVSALFAFIPSAGGQSSTNLQLSQARHFPSALNAQGDLSGENWGTQIVFNWAYEDGAAAYVIYRSASASGPWEELGTMSDAVARTSGSKIDDTPDARLMDVCYKVHAIDTIGKVLRVYEPMCVPKFVASQPQDSPSSPAARNSQGTLFGQNEGDFIILQWDLNDGATVYNVYRSTSLNGPWKQTGLFSQAAARTGGAKVDYTPDAKIMDLCYKVEALDAAGLVIEIYEPICVPKFVP